MSDGPRLEDQICFALYAASRALTATYASPLLAPLELTYPQYLVMLVLWETDGVRVSAIGDRLALDSATLTPLLKRLETRDVIQRRRSTADERVVEVFLTAAGRRLRTKAKAVPECILEASGMTVRQALDMRSELLALIAHLRASS